MFGGRGLPLYSVQQVMYNQAYGAEQWQEPYNEYHEHDQEQEEEYCEDATDGAYESFVDDHAVDASAEAVHVSSLLSPTAAEFKPGGTHIDK